MRSRSFKPNQWSGLFFIYRTLLYFRSKQTSRSSLVSACLLTFRRQWHFSTVNRHFHLTMMVAVETNWVFGWNLYCYSMCKITQQVLLMNLTIQYELNGAIVRQQVKQCWHSTFFSKAKSNINVTIQTYQSVITIESLLTFSFLNDLAIVVAHNLLAFKF